MRMRRPLTAAIPAIASGAVCGGASVAASAGAPARWELETFRWANDLPSWLYVPLWPLMQFGTLGAIPVTACVALLCRRRRLVLGIAAAGLVGYVSAKVIKGVVERGRPADFLTNVNIREQFGAESLGYPSGHAVVAARVVGFWLHIPAGWLAHRTLVRTMRDRS